MWRAPRAQDDHASIPDDLNRPQVGSVVLVSSLLSDGTFRFHFQPDFRAPNPPAGTVDLSLTRIPLDLLAPDLRLVLLTLADVQDSNWFDAAAFTRFVAFAPGENGMGA
jgi:hypothetical protein